MARMNHVVVSGAASGVNEIVAAVAGYRIRVMGGHFVADSAVTVTWKSATTALGGASSYAANGGPVLPIVPWPRADAVPPDGWFETAAGEALNMVLGGAVGVRGWLKYVLVKDADAAG